jgi:hypothetical protein
MMIRKIFTILTAGSRRGRTYNTFVLAVRTPKYFTKCTRNCDDASGDGGIWSPRQVTEQLTREIYLYWPKKIFAKCDG